MRLSLQAASFSRLVMSFPILVPDFRKKIREMTVGLYVLRVIAWVGVQALGPDSPGLHQKVDLSHVAPRVAQAERSGCC